MEKPDIRWSALEYADKARGADWYWAVWIITISIAVTAILFNNVLFAGVIVLATLALCLFTKRQPTPVNYKIDDKGVWAGRNIYLYNSLDSFWVDDENEPKIILKSQKMTMPYIVIPIEGISPEAIRSNLAIYLREEEHNEPLSHKIMEYLGF